MNNIEPIFEDKKKEPDFKDKIQKLAYWFIALLIGGLGLVFIIAIIKYAFRVF